MKQALRVTWSELIAILAIVGVLASIFLPALARSREAARRASCQNNLKQLGLVCKMYANESPGERWPTLSRVPNNWMFDMDAVYPEYLSDLAILECPSSPFAPLVDWTTPECATSLFYNYTGWLVMNDEQAMAQFNAYYVTPDLVIGGSQLTALTPVWVDREGRDGSASMGVIWDRVPLTDAEFSHAGRGINVLIMDGHVEHVPYSHYNASEYFPVTRIAAETFGSVLPMPTGTCAN